MLFKEYTYLSAEADEGKYKQPRRVNFKKRAFRQGAYAEKKMYCP